MQDFQGRDSTETDADGTHGHTPPFGGTVRDAGGGLVEIIVDRDTEYYPETGAHVHIVVDVPDPHVGMSWNTNPCNHEWPCAESASPHICDWGRGHPIAHRCKCGVEVAS